MTLEPGRERNVILSSFILLLFAQACFESGWHMPGALLLLAGWVMLWKMDRYAVDSAKLSPAWIFAVATALALAALSLRLWNLGVHPPVWGDEGIEAYDVRCLIAGRPLESLGGISYHRSPLWLGLRSLTAIAAGTSFLAMTTDAVAVGTITVVLVFLLGSRMFGPAAGILAGLLLCFHPWLLHQSRMLQGNILVPAVGLLIILVCSGSRLSIYTRAVLAGILAGVNLYGYAAGLHLPALAALALLIPWGNGEPLDRRLKAAVVTLAIPAACLLPGFLLVPGYWDRAVSVSVLGNPWMVLGNAIDSLRLFLVHGDDDMLAQYPAGAPAFGLMLGPVFALGLGLTFRFAAGPRMLLLIGWLALSMSPGLASIDGGRHLFRMVGTPPVMAIIAALGSMALVRVLGMRRGWALVALLWTGEAYLDLRTYFVEYPADRATTVWFRTYAHDAGRALKAQAELGKITICPQMTLAMFPVEKYYLFDAIMGGKVEFASGTCADRGKVLRVFRDGYGTPQAVLLETAARHFSYRTLEDVCGEGQAMQDGGGVKEVAAFYRRWDAVFGGSPLLRERVGFAQLKAGLPVEAEKAFRSAIGRGPGLASSWDGLGAALFRQGKYEEAEAAISRALTLDPGSREFLGDLEMVKRAKEGLGRGVRAGK